MMWQCHGVQGFIQDFLLKNVLKHHHLGESGGMPPFPPSPLEKKTFEIAFQAYFDQKLVLISKQ